MQQRDNTGHFILTGAVVFGLTLLVAVVDAQAQIVFSSDRDGNFEIYVMDTDGKKPQRLTNAALLTKSPHGHPTVNALSLCPSDRQDDWNVKST